ncbi:MAG: NADPH:quinone oxidoreductase family protein [Acidimicrobiales bacterium]
MTSSTAAWQVSDSVELNDLSLARLTTPTPSAGELLVQVHGAALNFSDLLMIQNKYQVRPDRPFTPGQELSGIVIATGPECTRSVGDRVTSRVPWGAFAEHAIVRDDMALDVPAHCDLTDAAAMPVVGLTAIVALTEATQLQAGETVLVHAGAGGVGLASVQVARALGATVIATAGSPKKCSVATKWGAHHVINYRNEDFAGLVNELTNGNGANVVVDSVGGDTSLDSLSCLAWRGRLLIVGFASGKIQNLPANRLLLKAASAIGVYWDHDLDLAMVRRAEKRMYEFWADGSLQPVVDRRQGLEAVPQALDDLAQRRTSGKVVIACV